MCGGQQPGGTGRAVAKADGPSHSAGAPPMVSTQPRGAGPYILPAAQPKHTCICPAAYVRTPGSEAAEVSQLSRHEDQRVNA